MAIEIIYDAKTNQIKRRTFTAPPPDFTSEKKNKLYQLVFHTKSHIESQYPEIKQRSDVADKEYYGSWLVTNVADANGNPAYTSDQIYRQAFTYGAQIWYGSKTLSQILSDIQTNELPNLQPAGTYGGTRQAWEQEFLFAWEQLIKIAVRVAFVQACKNAYRQTKAQIDQAQSLQELDLIQFPNLPDLPQEFR